MLSPNEVLQKYWGFKSLRPAQQKAVNYVLQGQDVITLMPTGGGKSVCFQVPSLMKNGICIVISPLISLMQDQVNSLKEKNIRAISISGPTSYRELTRKLDNCLYGGYKFLYLSPERLQQNLVQEYIQEMNVNLIAIDEAHCISEWGHDFRPAYREIKILKELQPEVPFIALTATATPKVLQDIQENLALENAKLVKMSFARENIALQVKKTEDKNYELQKFLTKNPGVSIIYVRSRKLTLNLKEFLLHHNISAEAYHGGMNTEQKDKLLKNWQEESFKVMVATNAFGMGIDKANVKNVIHYQIPDSLENYYQEVGRAGRNGQESNALLVYENSDLLRLKDQFLKNAPTPESTKFIYKKLNSYFSIAYGEGIEQSYNFSFLDFCHTYKLNTYLTYNVLQFLDQLEVLKLSKEFHQRTELFFKIPNRELHAFLDQQPYFKNLIHTLLRNQGGYFNYKSVVNLKQLESKSGIPRSSINAQLKKLEDLEIITLTLADQDSTIEFLVPREDDFTINPLIPYIKKYYKNKKYKIDKIISFVENDTTCKLIQLLAYFGENQQEKCGKCSVCLAEKNKFDFFNQNYTPIQKAIVDCLKEEKELNSREITFRLDYSEEEILYVIREMLDQKQLIKTKRNTYILK